MNNEHDTAREEPHEAIAKGRPSGSSFFDIVKALSTTQRLIVGSFCLLLLVSVSVNFVAMVGLNYEQSENSIPIGWILLLGLTLVAITALCFAFWSSYVRTIYLKDGPALVPEKWGSVIDDLSAVSAQNNNKLRSELSSALSFLKDAQLSQSQKSEELLSSFLTLQKSLSDRDAEISRLKSGYDSHIYRRFLIKFVRIANSLKDLQSEADSASEQKNFEFLRRLMSDALEECGVEEFEPTIGTDFREAGHGVADDPKVISTNDADEDFMIAKIQSPGYKLDDAEQPEVIIPAKVAIFRFNPKAGEE